MVGVVACGSIYNLIALFNGKELGDAKSFIVSNQVAELWAEGGAPRFDSYSHAWLIEIDHICIHRLIWIEE